MTIRFISHPRASLALLAVMVLPLCTTFAVAQGSAAAQAADPAAPVPTAQYRSVFSDLPTGVEPARDDWKKANAEVGRFTRGHADILKWEQQQQAKAPHPMAPTAHPMMKPDATKPVAPAANKN